MRKKAEGPTPASAGRLAGVVLRPRMTLLAVFLLLAVVGLVMAYLPQTVAAGGEGDDAWRLRVAPGITAPSLHLEGPGGDQRAEGFDLDASLESTVIWQTDGYESATATAAAATVVAGPTPRQAGSIRVTSVERGVGEAVIERVLWRRIHVAVLPAEVWVTDLAAIGRSGEVREVVAELPPPVAPPEPEPTG